MFEIMNNEECTMIGNWVDVLEFANRWESFTEIEKAILGQINDFTGTIAQLAKEIDYEYETFKVKFAVNHLVSLELVDYNPITATWTVLPMPEMINKILEF